MRFWNTFLYYFKGYNHRWSIRFVLPDSDATIEYTQEYKAQKAFTETHHLPQETIRVELLDHGNVIASKDLTNG